MFDFFFDFDNKNLGVVILRCVLVGLLLYLCSWYSGFVEGLIDKYDWKTGTSRNPEIGYLLMIPAIVIFFGGGIYALMAAINAIYVFTLHICDGDSVIAETVTKIVVFAILIIFFVKICT